MKKVFYSRHAKSSWEHLYLKDIDRPLNSRGKADAPFMAAKLRELLGSGAIDAILSSSSQRTRETLVPFAEAFSIQTSDIIFDDSLYLADSDYLVEALYQLPDNYQSVLVFAHNPGMTYLANEIAKNNIENVPTCGLFLAEFDATSWSEVSTINSKMDFFIYPKMDKQ